MKRWEIEKQPTPEYDNAPFDIVCEGDCIAMHVSAEHAKLIAAAPEMYEALKVAIDEMNGMGCRLEACLKVEAAIAKAEGTQ